MRTFMKFYFWPYLFANLVGAFLSFEIGFSDLELVWSTVINIFSLLAVFFYAFDIKLWPPVFWQVCFFLFIADLAYNLIFPSSVFGIISPLFYDFCYLFGVGLGLPAVISVYLYAFKNNAKNA